MSDESSIDLIRWSFTIDPERQGAVDEYFKEHGLEPTFHADGLVVVLWDEPEVDSDALIEGLWEVHGSTFEVTHEEFHRVNLLAYQEEDGGDSAEAA
ncbi:MAG: hypothetical protein U0800_21810 [Isosphaeraceae bacterium]